MVDAKLYDEYNGCTYSYLYTQMFFYWKFDATRVILTELYLRFKASVTMFSIMSRMIVHF